MSGPGDNETSVKISGDAAGAKGAMNDAAKAVKDGVSSMTESLGSLGGIFQTIQSHFAGIAALLAGGAAFKGGIDATKELTADTVRLSKTLGVSLEAASTLNVALLGIGSSAEVYADANAKLVRQVRTNEEHVKAMGVATRDANGQFLNGETLMKNALTTLASYKEGTDRNLAGQQLFGKGAAEVNALLKLNAKVMEEAAEKARALGLVVGPEQAAKTREYKEAMEGVHLVLLGVQNAIGQAIMPMLTKFAGWFNDAGPVAVSVMREVMATFMDLLAMFMDLLRDLWGVAKDVFQAIGEIVTEVLGQDGPGAMEIWKNALTVVKAAMLAAKLVIELAFELIRTAILQTIERLKQFAAVAVAAFHLDWEGVKRAWSDGTARVEKVISDSQQRIKDRTLQAATDMQRILEGGNYASPAAGGTSKDPIAKGTRSFVDPKTKDDASALLKARYELLKAGLEAELNLQKEYLAEAQDAYDYAYKHNLLTIADYFSKKLSTDQQIIQSSIRVKEAELEQAKALAAKAAKEKDALALQIQVVKVTGELAVLNARYAQLEISNNHLLTDALLARRNAMLEIQRVSTQSSATSQIELERVALDQKKALHEVTDAQALAAEKAFQARLYDIDRTAIEARRALADGDPVKLAQINADLEQLERQHQVNMAKIDKDIIVESQKDMLAAQTTIENGFRDMIASLGDRTTTLQQKLLNFASVIEKTFLDLAAKNIMKNILGSIDGGGGGNWLGGIVSKVFGGVPSFDVGTNYVPHDMLALIHRGEKITPAAQNTGSVSGGNGPIYVTVNVPPTMANATAQQTAVATGLAVQSALRRGT